MAEPTLYLFVGFPGAGKTTVARMLHEATGAEHIWADQERQEQFGTPKLTQAQLDQFYVRLNELTDRLLGEGKSVIFDTNFNYRKDRQTLREIGLQHAAKTVVVWMTTPVELARTRAVDASDGQHTRVWGNMDAQDFADLSCRLEEPDSTENAVKVDGTHVTPETIQTILEH